MVPRLRFGARYFFFISWRYQQINPCALAGDPNGNRASLSYIYFDQAAGKTGRTIWSESCLKSCAVFSPPE